MTSCLDSTSTSASSVHSFISTTILPSEPPHLRCSASADLSAASLSTPASISISPSLRRAMSAIVSIRRDDGGGSCRGQRPEEVGRLLLGGGDLEHDEVPVGAAGLVVLGEHGGDVVVVVGD